MIVPEAKKIIETALKDWNTPALESKIISLARFVQKWNSTAGGPVKRMRALQKSISDLESL